MDSVPSGVDHMHVWEDIEDRGEDFLQKNKTWWEGPVRNLVSASRNG
jgi:hypothetical protein